MTRSSSLTELEETLKAFHYSNASSYMQGSLRTKILGLTTNCGSFILANERACFGCCKTKLFKSRYYRRHVLHES